MGVNVSIVVVNGEGNVLLIARMDSAGFLTPDIAIAKAIAAVAFRRSSGEVQNRLRIRRLSSRASQRWLTAGFLPMGGLPVLKDQQIRGPVCVSGANPEEDQAIAQAGIDAF